MTKQELLQAELKSARKKVEALPAWRRAVLERARAAEIELGYIRSPSEAEGADQNSADGLSDDPPSGS